MDYIIATNCPCDELSGDELSATNCLATNYPCDELSATNCPRRIVLQRIVLAPDHLQTNVIDYLISIKVANKQQRDLYSISEQELLLNRLSRILDTEQPDLKICPNHRFTYGIGWSVPKSCVYIKEDGNVCHLRSDRVAPIHLIRTVPTFPFGGQICTKHRKCLYEYDTQTNAVTDKFSGVHSWEMDTDDLDQVNKMLVILEQSPIKSQANKIPIENQASSSQRRLIAKLRKSVAASTTFFANFIVPGEAEKLIEMAGLGNVIEPRSSSSASVTDDLIMQRIIQIYKALEQKQYPFIERIQLLAILPENMNNNEIIEKFGCSNYAIKTARKLQLATTTPTHHEEPSKVIRNRINPQQTDHFLSWLLHTNILTTVAWGITKITLDSGVVLGLIAYNLDSMLMINSVDDDAIDELGFRRIFFNKNRPIYMLELPKQVFQGKKSHIIYQYQMHCREMALESLSDRTLRHILDGISTTEQEALSGIDDFVKDAREGWIIFEKLVSFLKITKEDRDNILTTIKQNKLYLKTLFINHCSEEQTKACTTHCAVYSLSQRGSDYYNEKCDHYHNQICHDCASLIETFDLIDQQIALITDTEERNELQYDFGQAEAAIIELMRHLIRSVQQDDAKSKMLNELGDETAFVTIDWAQKILQQKHRESQSEYYGKKGMSVLVSSFTIKDCNQPQQGKFITKTYMLAITNCSQNELDTLSGGFLLLEQFKKDHQYIKKIIKRSDNASVLGGHVTFEAEKVFCDKLGVQILIRDYSEVQSGKSICDRMAGAAKLRMRAWINAGNNLLAASDIKKGMEYCGGVKNVKVATAELINNKTKIDNADTLPEVSSIRSVVYTNDGMIIRKASNIGRGRLIPYVNLQVTSNMKLIESFSPSSQQSNTTKQTERIDRKMNSFYFCPENNCICTFKDEAGLHDHIALGQHVTTGDKMNTYDIAKIQLYDKLRDVDLSTISIQPVTTSSSITTKLSEKLNGSRTMKYFSIEGWALKVQKPRRRIDEGVKSFIRTIIHEGKLYSVKFSEEEFVRRIRTARYSDGTKMFSPDQYLTASQVKTQIKLLSSKSSSTAAKEHKYVTRDSHVENDENENQYKKTPRLSRKQISIRSLTNESSLESSSQSSNEHSILNQGISDDTIDEQDELAFEQEKQIDALKKRILK